MRLKRNDLLAWLLASILIVGLAQCNTRKTSPPGDRATGYLELSNATEIIQVFHDGPQTGTISVKRTGIVKHLDYLHGRGPEDPNIDLEVNLGQEKVAPLFAIKAPLSGAATRDPYMLDGGAELWYAVVDGAQVQIFPDDALSELFWQLVTEAHSNEK